MFEYKGRRTRVAALRDISERKKASQALKESEQLYKALFEKNTTVILLINPGDGHIVDANPAACAFYGYDRADLTRMKISEINQLTPSQVKMEMAMAQSEQRQYFNFRHRISTGLVRDVEVYSGPVQVHDRPLLCSIIHDISERKAIEAERESLILKLKKALEEIKTLKGIVPICSSCNKIRDDQGYWNRLEAYIEERSHASFSHGICPDCSDKLYGEEEWYDENKADKK
ncbi:MAG: PAS domain S-box protein [Desulfobacterales bacterium]|nr:PAS domain S-box protein [Desulfobacterales bacterium]